MRNCFVIEGFVDANLFAQLKDYVRMNSHRQQRQLSTKLWRME